MWCLTGNCSNRKTGPDVLDVSGVELVDTHFFLRKVIDVQTYNMVRVSWLNDE